MRLDGGKEAEFSRLLHEGKSQFERLGRESAMPAELHVDMNGSGFFQIAQQLGKLLHVGRCHTAHEDEPVPADAFCDLRAWSPADSIKAGLANGAQLSSRVHSLSR